MRRVAVSALAVSAALAVPFGAVGSAGAATAPVHLASAKAGSPCDVAGLVKTTKPVQVTFWESMTQANATTLTDLTNAFNKSQSHVHVNLVFSGGADDIWTKVQAGLTTGDLPTMAQVQDVDLQGAIDSKAFTPVQACMDAARYKTADFVPRILAYWKVGGKQIALPFNVSVPVVYYNEQSFKKAGLSASSPPATLPQYVADAKKLERAGSGTGLVLDQWHLETWLATADQLFVNHDNGRSGRTTKSVFGGTKDALAVYSELDGLVRSGAAVTNPPSGPDAFDNLLGIGSGKYGMTIDTSADLGTIESLLAKYPNVTLGVGAFPALSSSARGGIEPGGDALYITAKDSPLQKAAAWEYMAFLDSTSSQATWAAGTGYVPVRKSAVATPTISNLWKTNPGFKVAYDELTRGIVSPATSGSAIGPYEQVRQAEADAEESMYTKDVAPKKALSGLATQINQILSSYNGRL